MKRAAWLGLSIAAVALPRAAWAQTTGPIVNSQTGLVIIPRGLSANPGAQLTVWPSGGSPTQNWSLVPTEQRWFKIVNQGNGLCIGVDSGSTADGAKVIQWRDNGHTSQEWRWRGEGRNRVLVNRNSGKVIGVAGASTEQGTNLIQWHEDGTPNQRWHLQR